MNFGDQTRQVLRGQKRQHRILLRRASRRQGGYLLPCPLKPEHHYPIAGARDQDRIMVLSTARQRLGSVSEDEARAEGHASAAAFSEHWLRRHDADWVGRNDLPARPELNLPAMPLTAEDVAARFAGAWAMREVWAVTFRLADDVPRFLSPTGGQSGEGSMDYTMSAASALDSAEAVDEHTQARFAEKANRQLAHWREVERKTREKDRERMATEDRVKQAHRRAVAAGLDLRGEFGALRYMLRHPKKQGQEHFARQLLAVERRLDERAPQP